VVSDNSTATESPHDAILGIIKYYVLIGFLSVIFYWIAWASWIMAAERQVRRIRFVIRSEKLFFFMEIRFLVMLFFKISYDKRLVGLMCIIQVN